jgi:hypothetical protein
MDAQCGIVSVLPHVLPDPERMKFGMVMGVYIYICANLSLGRNSWPLIYMTVILKFYDFHRIAHHIKFIHAIKYRSN